MMGLVGIVIVFVMVFGGYLAAGGKLGIILHALPFEMMMIAGAAAGAFLIGNDAATVKHALRDIPLVFRGPRWKPADYRDLLCLLFSLIRLARQNPLAVEEHVETPAESAIFGRYPRILADAEAVAREALAVSFVDAGARLLDGNTKSLSNEDELSWEPWIDEVYEAGGTLEMTRIEGPR